MRKSPRVRRLNSDYNSVKQLRAESSIFTFESKGSPPQRYRLIFHGAGFQKERSGRISIVHHHEVLVELGAAYPRMVPNLAWQTPIFHPNISNNGVVCLGSYGTHWVPSLTLSEMATMLWDMIRYKNFDTESPYNREAAIWAKMQTDFRFPVDPRSIRDKLTGESELVVAAPPVKAAPPTIIETPPEVRVTRVDEAPSNQVEIIDVTSDGIEIISAQVVEQEPQPPVELNDGIMFLD